MASEDSDQVVPGFLAIHGLCDLNDLDQPLRLEMSAGGDELHAADECFEVEALRGQQRVRLEERYDYLQELRASLDAILQEILAMIVVPGIPMDAPYSEESLKILEAASARSTLRDSKAVSHLIAGRVAATARSVWLPNEAD